MSPSETMPTYRCATAQDAPAMALVERAARALLAGHGVRLDDVMLPEGFEESPRWTFALVAEVHNEVVGIARLSELTPDLLVLDQVSVDPAFARRGLGRGMLLAVADEARDLGYAAITGTTFRDLLFNGPFYAALGCVEDSAPHPAMAQRREFEAAAGLDAFGPRIVMRASL